MPFLESFYALGEDVAKLVVAHGLAATIGAAGGYGFRLFQDYRRARRVTASVRDFFGFEGRELLIVHSAILDATRQAYNFPSCDTRASRAVAHLLESVGRSEGSEFSIISEDEFSNRVGELRNANDCDLVFLCGPKRNKLVAELMGMMPYLRYQLSRSPLTGENLLFDRERNSHFVSSRDTPDGASAPGYDFGLSLSAPSPLSASRRVVVLAGIHGTGTLAAALYISDPGRLAALCQRRHDGIVQEVVRAEYRSDSESIAKMTLV